MSASQLLDPPIRCPSCRFGNLNRLSIHEWKCSTCGYWTVNPPANPQRMSRRLREGSTPLTREQQTEEVQQGKDYWKTLLHVGKKVAFGFFITYTILSFSLELAVLAALDRSLTLTWTITAGVGSVFLGIVGLLLFWSSSMKRRAIFGTILVFFITTGNFWYQLVLHTITIFRG